MKRNGAGEWTPEAILETVVYAEDLDAARGFYRDLLGLELASDDPPRHLFFRLNNGMLLVFNPTETASAEVQVAGAVIPKHGPSGGSSHFAFQATEEQLEALMQRLLDHGVAIESEIEWPHGARSIYCRDPAGNSVEFATPTLWFDA